MAKGFIPPHGGYEKLLSYQKARVVYEGKSYRTYIETRPAHVVANILICLIHQTNYLQDQHLRQLERAFLQEGGLRERMTRARLAQRASQHGGLPDP